MLDLRGSVLGIQVDPATKDQIEEAVKRFGDGFMQPALCASKNIYTYGKKEVPLVIALGISNSYEGTESEPYLNPDLNYNHGSVWAALVKAVNQYFVESNYPKLTAAGAIDAERNWWFFYDAQTGDLHPYPQPTLSWARGYNSVPEALSLYNFGSMDGAKRDSSWNVPDSNDIFEVFYELSWGLRVARPLPQVYSWGYAKEWYQLKRYVATKKARNMEIFGVMSSYRNIQDNDGRRWPELNVGDKTLSPNASWQGMYDSLNRTLKEDANVINPFFTTDIYRTPQGIVLNIPSNAGCSSGAVYEENTLVPTNTCISSGTIFRDNSTFTQQFQVPPEVDEKVNRSTMQLLPWSTNMTYGYVPPLP